MASSSLVYRIRDRSTFRNLVAAPEPIPTLAGNEVLVRIRGVTLNYRDVVICNGKYPFPVKDNVVPCADSAGDVVAVGSSVKDISVGDRVITNFNLTHLYGPVQDFTSALGGTVDGVLREHMAVPAFAVTKIPPECKLSYVQLASLVASGSTSWNALFGGNPLRPGQTVLVQGTGGVAIAGLQIAKAAGAAVIVASSSDEKLKFVQEHFGADHLINYRTTPNWAAEVLRVTHGRGADHVLETGGAGTIKQSIEACTVGGAVSSIGFLASVKQEDMPDVAALVMRHQCTLRGVQVGSKQIMEELVRFVTVSRIEPYIHQTFGFGRDEVLQAFDAVHTSRHIGKIGIDLQLNPLKLYSHNVPWETAHGYSQVVVAGETAYFSGQFAHDESGPVAEGDFAA